MKIKRVVLVPPAAPGSKGDEGMMHGALSLLDDLPLVILNPEDQKSWINTLKISEPRVGALAESKGPIRDFCSSLRGGDLLLFVGADVVDGTFGIEPAMDRIDLMAEAVLHGLPVFVACSFRSYVDGRILERLRTLTAIHFLLRDDHSLENFMLQTQLSANFFPDLSFFLQAQLRMKKSRRSRKHCRTYGQILLL